MDAIPETPTEPLDYATLNAVYGVLLGAVLLAARGAKHGNEPITGAELVPIAAATFTLSKTIAHEKVATWVREPFVEQDEEGGAPKGRRMRHAVGELLTCTRCLGTWSSLALVGLRVTSPPAGRIVTAVLAASAVNDFLQVGFELICAESSRAKESAG